MFFYNDNSSILFLATLINSDTSGFSNFCPNLCKLQNFQKYSAKSNQKSSKLHERLQKTLKRRKTVPKRCKKTLKIQNSSVVTKVQTYFTPDKPVSESEMQTTPDQ